MSKTIWATTFLLLVLLMFVGCSQNTPSPTAVTSGAATNNSDPILLPVKVSGKWGYVNDSGQLVINPQFDAAEEFHEGRAAVCLGKPCSWYESPKDSRWGFIDTSGKVIVTPQYASASFFSEGLAAVCTGDCSGLDATKTSIRGYIDRDGKLAIPMQFGIAMNFKEGLAQVCIGRCNWEKDNGYNGKFGFVDHSGHFVINPQYDNADSFDRGFAAVTLGKGDQAKTGYVDKTGRIIWQPSN
jgi:hypothetical protein